MTAHRYGISAVFVLWFLLALLAFWPWLIYVYFAVGGAFALSVFVYIAARFIAEGL